MRPTFKFGPVWFMFGAAPAKHICWGFISECFLGDVFWFGAGALLIFDEIPNSLGRTGSFFTFEKFGVVPDMVVIGKGLGGGVMPISALIATEALNEVCKTRALGHYTHEKSPVGCAAGLATIEQVTRPQFTAPYHLISPPMFALF